MSPLAIAAVLVAMATGDAPEAAAPSPANIEDCVYDRALEYDLSKAPQTDDTDARAQKILLDICVGHGLPLLPHESTAVRRGLDRAFKEAIFEALGGGNK